MQATNCPLRCGPRRGSGLDICMTVRDARTRRRSRTPKASSGIADGTVRTIQHGMQGSRPPERALRFDEQFLVKSDVLMSKFELR